MWEDRFIRHILSFQQQFSFKNNRIPVSAAVGIATGSLVVGIWVVRDYQRWRSFGVGGSPPNSYGYSRSLLLGLVNKVTFYNTRDASSLSATNSPRLILDDELPTRQGPSVRILFPPLPHRQAPEQLSGNLQNKLHALIPALGLARPDLFEIRASQTEGGTTSALYARAENPKLNPVARKPFYTLDKEIAHIHPEDNSLHVWLSEADAKAVIEKGWGERFVVSLAPNGFVMVYAPRSEDELRTVECIVKGAAKWISGADDL
ncbi:uncharacterized protein N7458_011252 [Penicillium daleae]|uniref:Luciferase domain-containing protein n=1 Tax=Penicillium daleae TaxID=63821 RepID=A0AAD6BQZ8_9EURO|nr:uncharacterized protein N7458_011252 [Penicillium daleae]KAJ5432096.1 hypothetical protein N7458_011252 [Penicillium daleae]